MLRSRVRELHYITHVDNVPSILTYGVLSHQRAQSVQHRSVASEEVQGRRTAKRLPNGAQLHDYANLYFDARNPMMSRLLYDGVHGLIVVRISSDVLDIPGTILTDGNAAADATRFYSSPGGLSNLDDTLIYAISWNDQDFWRKIEKKRVRNAEVLVPNMVGTEYIRGCYASDATMRTKCQMLAGTLEVGINETIYFG